MSTSSSVSLRALAAACFLCGAVCMAPAQAQTPSEADSADVLIARAKQTLQQLDRGEDEALWASTMPFIRQTFKKSKFLSELHAAHKGFQGKVASRGWIGVWRVLHPAADPRSPAGLYANVEMGTRLTDGQVVVERVSMGLDQEGHWRLTGYIVRPGTAPAAHP